MPITAKLYEPGGVPPPLLLLLPPPQPHHVITSKSTHAGSSQQSARLYRLRTPPRSSTNPGKPKNVNHSANLLAGASPPGYASPAVPPVVVTVTVTFVGLEPLSFTEPGDTEHVDIAGAPVQLSVTVWLNPPRGATAIVYWALCPGVTVALDEEDRATEKSSPIPLSGTVCGLLIALSVIVRTPFLWPLVVGSKNTPMEQFAPGAMGLPQELSGAKSLGLAATLVTVTTESPVLVNVTVCGRPDVPTYWLGKATIDGDTLTPVTPVPVKGTACWPPVALSVTTIEAFATPNPVGENVA